MPKLALHGTGGWSIFENLGGAAESDANRDFRVGAFEVLRCEKGTMLKVLYFRFFISEVV
jgi:hypothetical protein